MSVFKLTITIDSDEGEKCLTMGDFGHTLNYHPIQLEDCTNVPSLDITTTITSSENTRFQIMSSDGQCLQPFNYSDLTNKDVVLGTCDASSTFTIRTVTGPWSVLAWNCIPISSDSTP